MGLSEAENKQYFNKGIAVGVYTCRSPDVDFSRAAAISSVSIVRCFSLLNFVIVSKVTPIYTVKEKSYKGALMQIYKRTFFIIWLLFSKPL